MCRKEIWHFFLRLSELCGSYEKVDVEEELLTAVEEAMKSCIREQTGEDENENSVVGKVALVSEAVNYLKKQNGAQPTQKELADYVKIPEDELADILYMIDKAKKKIPDRGTKQPSYLTGGLFLFSCNKNTPPIHCIDREAFHG